MWNSDEYIEVKDRIIKFYTDHPDGRIQTEVTELTEKRVTVKAYVYQTTEDPVPTTGHSYLNIPGSTNFTRGSELENAETSAVGRALALSGYEVKKSIASRDEIDSKQDDRPIPAAPSEPAYSGTRPSKPITEKQKGLLNARIRESSKDTDEVTAYCKEQFAIENISELTMDELDIVLAWLQEE